LGSGLDPADEARRLSIGVERGPSVEIGLDRRSHAQTAGLDDEGRHASARCRTASNNKMPVAIDTFRLDTAPRIGTLIN
jgi:hypothetical protein